MIDQKIGFKCTGCTACKNVCPKNAIRMDADKEGFLYPRVQYDICVKCGLCIKKCPIIQGANGEAYNQPDVYAAWNLDQEIRINSTSGGIFSALAKSFILNKGIVVGACYDENFTIKHIVIKKEEEIERLRQSKYAQSNLGDILKEVRKYLVAGKMVLFCGTPCQSAGLQNYLEKEYSNLFCCDFICRGVISPAVYKKFLEDMGKRSNSILTKVQFKNKDFGWNRFSTKLIFDDGTVYQKDRNNDYYMRGYLKHNLYLRPSCHECYYKKIPRISDLSLGDFWGIGKYRDELDNDNGTSVILVNSYKGKQLLEWMKNDLYIEQRCLEDVLAGNMCLLKSAEKGQYRDYFFENMNRYSFDRLIEIIDEKSLNLPVKDRIFRLLHQIKMRLMGKRNG